jgi:hypothetical protein
MSTLSSTQMVIALFEEMITLHETNPAFRRLFKSQRAASSLSNMYRSTVIALNNKPMTSSTVSALEKMNHFVLALSLDPNVDGPHKRSVSTRYRFNSTPTYIRSY